MKQTFTILLVGIAIYVVANSSGEDAVVKALQSRILSASVEICGAIERIKRTVADGRTREYVGRLQEDQAAGRL